jgi:transcriptional regulator with XRE-family HTH domain
MVKYRLTQAQLAAQLGWKQTQISKLLRGARPSFDQAIRLLDMVDIPMADWASLNGRLLLNTPKAAPETEPEKK